MVVSFSNGGGRLRSDRLQGLSTQGSRRRMCLHTQVHEDLPGYHPLNDALIISAPESSRL